MFTKIMVPVDLEHTEQLSKSIEAAAGLSKQHSAAICFVGVGSAAPTAISHNAEEYEEKLGAFAQEQAAEHGIDATSCAFFSHDLVTEVDDDLLKAVKETGADLVVMASHVPNITDYVWPSNGGKIAANANASVFVVR
ncbi:MAG: universal stress protein [Pseudomonadota bacterium]